MQEKTGIYAALAFSVSVNTCILFESMAKKTLIMAIWKYLPLSTELMLVQDNDNTIKRDLGDIASEKDIITVTPSLAEDEDDVIEFEKEEVITPQTRFR